ncbi:nSTAND1 domain-containing NTPase [Streptomyces griseiscabiei]
MARSAGCSATSPAQTAGSARSARKQDEEATPPCRGLARFRPEDREVFFGRARLREELREPVCGHRFAVVFGASGSGVLAAASRADPQLQEAIRKMGRPTVLRILLHRPCAERRRDAFPDSVPLSPTGAHSPRPNASHHSASRKALRPWGSSQA